MGRVAPQEGGFRARPTRPPRSDAAPCVRPPPRLAHRGGTGGPGARAEGWAGRTMAAAAVMMPLTRRCRPCPADVGGRGCARRVPVNGQEEVKCRRGRARGRAGRLRGLQACVHLQRQEPRDIHPRDPDEGQPRLPGGCAHGVLVQKGRPRMAVCKDSGRVQEPIFGFGGGMIVDTIQKGRRDRRR